MSRQLNNFHNRCRIAHDSRLLLHFDNQPKDLFVVPPLKDEILIASTQRVHVFHECLDLLHLLWQKEKNYLLVISRSSVQL